jgi:hypothetical protein
MFILSGFAVPHLSLEGKHNQLQEWAINKGEDGLKTYWQNKYQLSIGGIPTHIIEKIADPFQSIIRSNISSADARPRQSW